MSDQLVVSGGERRSVCGRLFFCQPPGSWRMEARVFGGRLSRWPLEMGRRRRRPFVAGSKVMEWGSSESIQPSSVK